MAKKITTPYARVTIRFNKADRITPKAVFANVDKILVRHEKQVRRHIELAAGALAMAEKKGLEIIGTSYTFVVHLK